ncbi:hypothetical protein [Fibrobacter sp. UWB13]|jgi:hypothetical protein|uniref:hypothetical protein n=1 Tax=Fibrobacter sp. UWB13 TaxID=1896204 RepID=UPI000A0B6D2C|nr:hypothetical protein [Fibrobacter sp. UWB13]SMG16446.1 hypothetical protein SAMN05720489_0845 [Fibrobacter sp. UWB13]
MRKFLAVCALFSILVTSAFAAPASSAKAKSVGSTKIYGAIEAKDGFLGGRLFDVLDSVGGTGTWMEWDVNGVRDPSVMKVLDPLLNSTNKPKMIWAITERAKPLLAVLLPKGAGEVIVFYELGALDGKPVQLKLNKVLSPDVVFRDYKQISEKEFVHLDRPNLKISVLDKMIRFTYDNPDKTPLRYDPDFAKKTIVEKRTEVNDYLGFLKYEYSMMLRAFVQSTRGIFNWQPWHWYMDKWNAKSMISAKEIEMILSKGVPPEYITVFKAKASSGEMIEMRTTGNGFLEMVITRP